MVGILLGNLQYHVLMTCIHFLVSLFSEVNMLATRHIRIWISMFGDVGVVSSAAHTINVR